MSDHEQERLIFGDTYNLLIRFLDMPNTYEDWCILRDEAKRIRNKYPEPLCQDILVGILKHIEEKQKKSQTNGN